MVEWWYSVRREYSRQHSGSYLALATTPGTRSVVSLSTPDQTLEYFASDKTDFYTVL
jgi:hypothetical protein